MSRKQSVESQKDGSVSNVLTAQIGGPQFDPWNPHIKKLKSSPGRTYLPSKIWGGQASSPWGSLASQGGEFYTKYWYVPKHWESSLIRKLRGCHLKNSDGGCPLTSAHMTKLTFPHTCTYIHTLLYIYIFMYLI